MVTAIMGQTTNVSAKNKTQSASMANVN